MLKNVIAYLLTPGFKVDPEKLQRQQARPCGPSESRTVGFVNPCNTPTHSLLHNVSGIHVICLETEDRLLPGSVVEEEVRERAIELEQTQGHALGRKQRREVKERVIEELLPKAFTQKKRTLAFFTDRYFIVDTSSAARAGTMIECLRLALDDVPLTPIRTQNSMIGALAEWLTGNTPETLTVDDFAELEMPDSNKPAITYKRTRLDVDDMGKRLASGYQPRRVGITYDDRLSCKVDECLHLKQVAFLDLLRASNESNAENVDEQFDADVTLYVGQVVRVIDFLIEQLGGLVPDEPDLLTEAPATGVDDSEDELYGQAVGIVFAHQRASISLVQRHLRIGYNRAARLIEDMERNGLVSPMNSTGARRVLERKAA